jgi:hypothetical protein
MKGVKACSTFLMAVNNLKDVVVSFVQLQRVTWCWMMYKQNEAYLAYGTCSLRVLAEGPLWLCHNMAEKQKRK